MACANTESDCAAASGNWNSRATANGPASQSRARIMQVRIETGATIETRFLNAKILEERMACRLDDYEACGVNRKSCSLAEWGQPESVSEIESACEGSITCTKSTQREPLPVHFLSSSKK